MGTVDGKRVAKPDGNRPRRWPLVVLLVVLLALCAGYVGLCAYAAQGAFFPNTSILGVDVSGMSQAAAEEALKQQLPARQETLSVPFRCEGRENSVPGSDFTVDAQAAVQTAAQDQTGTFLAQGGQYLSALIAGRTYSGAIYLNGESQSLAQAVEECSDPEAQTTWSVEGDQLVLNKGVTGRTIDVAALTSALEERAAQTLCGWENGAGQIEAQVTTAPPAEPDFSAISREISVEAADAYLDVDTGEIVPSVVGVSLDEAAARTALAAAQEGERVEVPLTLTQPAMTTETLEANLFKDVLGTGSTKCSSPAERWYNIDLASSRVNGTILMPGETFSYNDHCGPYTLDSGYKKAGTYQNGQSVDATAGGICQLSSTLYWVTLKANLEIVERNKHAFNGGYMPVIGTDATVWSDVLDFKFKNNTEYPIKIEAYQDKNHYLHVTIYGTDTTGIHGEPYSVIISKVPYQNTYQPKDTIPVGSEPERDPNYNRYNGYTVDVYQKLVDKDGKTVDTIFLYRNTYKASNAVYYYNPADATRLGIDPATGLMTLTPVTPTPSASPTPAATPSATPSASPTPAATPTPVATPSQSPFSTPGATPEPETSATPAATPTPTAVPTAQPTPTAAPTATPVFTPGAIPEPDVTQSPAA